MQFYCMVFKCKSVIMNTRMRIIAVVCGLVSAMIVIMAFEWTGRFIYTAPTGIDFRNIQTAEDMMSIMPLRAFIWLLTGYAAGSLIGGMVATFLSGRHSTKPALIIGGVLTVFGVINLASIPHPLWFSVLSTLTYIPFAQLGCRLFLKKNHEGNNHFTTS
jgi:MFS family permease